MGELIVYTYDIANNGTEALTRKSIVDSVEGPLTSKFPATLNPGDSDTVMVFRQVLESDPRPLKNVVTAKYEAAGGSPAEDTAECTLDIVHVLVVKEASLSGGVFTFKYTVTNDGTTPLTRISVRDSMPGLGDISVYFPEQLAVGQREIVTLTKLQSPNDPLCDMVEVTYGHFGPGTLTVTKDRDDDCVDERTPTPTPTETATPTATPTATATATPTDGQGCTPGFWKSPKGRLLWDEPTDAIPVAIGTALGIAPVTTTSDFYAVFMVPAGTAGLPDPLTMLDAAKLGGGGAKKLTRHGVAALLNAAGVSYAYSVIQVKTMVRDALLSGNFEPLATNLDDANNAGCPFGRR
ncbi:MAG: hypothetical protein ACE5IZ_04745 [Dehalococcoidia bacterium]